MFAGVWFRHENIDLLADHFTAVIAEQFSGRAVDSLNDAGLIDCDGAVVHHSNDSLKLFKHLFRMCLWILGFHLLYKEG